MRQHIEMYSLIRGFHVPCLPLKTRSLERQKGIVREVDARGAISAYFSRFNLFACCQCWRSRPEEDDTLRHAP